ncbi:HTH_Tnp_Tc3_2 domain-containing protein [Trichonephila clavipes]|nr:HTH_Tnp_Tc3_2 domain-containing protein [Trichonephila clavipes]
MFRIEGSGPLHQSSQAARVFASKPGERASAGCTLKKCVATGSPSTTDKFRKLCWQQMFSAHEERIITHTLKKNMHITRNHQKARIVRHNDESVKEGYIRNGGKELKLITSALKVFQCNNSIVMAQMKHLDDFLRGRIIGRLECGRTQLEVSKELGIAQSVISRLWQRFQDVVTAKRNRRSTASYLYRQLSSATVTTVSRQTVYRRLGHVGLYARTPVTCVPLTTTHCRLRLTWSRQHALWTLQQWSCVMFSDEFRFSLQSDSHRI